MIQSVWDITIKREKYSHILTILSSMKRTDKNHSLLTECLLEEFSLHPERLHEFLEVFSFELNNTKGEAKEKLARRYIHIFSFLCERFGLYYDKHILDDLSFQILHPREYKKLKKELQKYQKNANSIIESVFAAFKEKLISAGINTTIEWRYKHISSIHRKCEKKWLEDILKIWDIFAFRIIVDGNEKLCYKVLDILHENFSPIPNRFKDYIRIPKINGYQSIHTSITDVHENLDIAVEVQIRTKQMHEIAESGIAAHFLYGKNKKSQMLNEKEKMLLQHVEDHSTPDQIERFLYCLTPDGDIKKLPYNGTVQDFARKVHSGLLEISRYALVNGEKQELSYPLRNFDTVELVTFKQETLW